MLQRRSKEGPKKVEGRERPGRAREGPIKARAQLEEVIPSASGRLLVVCWRLWVAFFIFSLYDAIWWSDAV